MSTVLDISSIPEKEISDVHQTFPTNPEFPGILKIENASESEAEELEFELRYQKTLTTQQRFEMMFRKSREIMEVMLRHRHRTPKTF